MTMPLRLPETDAVDQWHSRRSFLHSPASSMIPRVPSMFTRCATARLDAEIIDARQVMDRRDVLGELFVFAAGQAEIHVADIADDDAHPAAL